MMERFWLGLFVVAGIVLILATMAHDSGPSLRHTDNCRIITVKPLTLDCSR